MTAGFSREVRAPNRVANGVDRTANCLIVAAGTLYSGTYDRTLGSRPTFKDPCLLREGPDSDQHYAGSDEQEDLPPGHDPLPDSLWKNPHGPFLLRYSEKLLDHPHLCRLLIIRQALDEHATVLLFQDAVVQ